MTFILKALRAAVYQRLKTDAQLTGHGCTGVFSDNAPLDQKMPYITLGSDVYLPWNCFTPKGWDCTLMIDVWDGLDEGDRYTFLVEDVYRLLHEPTNKLVLADHIASSTECEWSTVVDDQANEVRHIPIRLRLYSQKA